MNNDIELIEELLHTLCTALPFVEDARDDPAYKPGYSVKVEEQIKEVIAKAEGRLK